MVSALCQSDLLKRCVETPYFELTVMALYRIGDRYPNYPDVYFEGNDVKGMTVASAEDAKVGTVSDIFIDEDNRIQFLVVDTGKPEQLLLPANLCSKNFEQDTVYVRSLNQEEFKRLQPYSPTGELYDRSEPAVEQSIPVEASAPVEGIAFVEPATQPQTAIKPAPTTPNQPSLTQSQSSAKDKPIQLYEERLITQKQRIKTGEVKISKQTITETTEADIPITREKVIIEIESIYSGQTRVDFGDAEVSADGTVRMGIYEEQAEICRRIVPHQTVSVRKEVVQDVIHTQQTVRREELDIATEGNPEIEWAESSLTE